MIDMTGTDAYLLANYFYTYGARFSYMSIQEFAERVVYDLFERNTSENGKMYLAIFVHDGYVQT